MSDEQGSDTLPPTVATARQMMIDLGRRVAVRRNRCGNLRYRLDDERERNGHDFVRRADALWEIERLKRQKT